MNRHTLQSRSARQSKRAAHFARLRARREAAILARPAPEYPPELPTSGEWLAGYVHGSLVVIHFHRDAKHRADQWAGELNGAMIESAAGLTVLCDRLRHSLGRPMSRRAVAGLQNGYTARDEADALGC